MYYIDPFDINIPEFQRPETQSPAALTRYAVVFRKDDEPKVCQFMGTRRGFLIFRIEDNGRDVAVLESMIYDYCRL